ncbi:MAG: arsenate reductase ArsC [Acidobacteria bacterium]|nr:arsenate reductase ArsC [Acidobacteriota bacterium]
MDSGEMTEAVTQERPPLKVLFVCLGNSCRSQMAEGLARKLAPHWEVHSAGVLPAGYVSFRAIRAMQEVGVDISSHRSKGLDEVELERMEVIVAMGGIPVSDFVPRPEGKVTRDWDIPDPLGHGAEFFSMVRDHIRSKIEELVAQLSENGA